MGLLARDDRALARWLALLVPAGLLGGALFSQYVGGLNPCEMCYWQRWPHWAAIALAILAFLVPRARDLFTALAAFAIATSGAIGVFHFGVEQQWWKGLTQCTAGGPMSLDDILSAPVIRCDQVQWDFLGLSMAGWNAVISLGAAALILFLVARKPR
jgi:disulfide bond formation protein DsbB